MPFTCVEPTSRPLKPVNTFAPAIVRVPPAPPRRYELPVPAPSVAALYWPVTCAPMNICPLPIVDWMSGCEYVLRLIATVPTEAGSSDGGKLPSSPITPPLFTRTDVPPPRLLNDACRRTAP